MSIAENLAVIMARIDAARKAAIAPAPATHLVAVSKTVPESGIREALVAGQRRFGENRVQEAAAKFPALKNEFPDLELHLIGPLQTNKVREATGLFDVIQTLDRTRLADALAAERGQRRRCPRLFVQVNTGEEPQKAGVPPREAGNLIHYARDMLKLPVEGLMCIPPLNDDAAPHFALLLKLARAHGLGNLSMGMSGDFELAIRFGATHVRVGSAIFGERSLSADHDAVRPGAIAPAPASASSRRSATQPCGRRIIRARHVQENRAAVALHHRIVIVAQHCDQIVEMILAPQRFRAGGVGQFHQPVVIGIVRRIAPAVIAGDRAQRQFHVRFGDAVGAVEDFPHRKNTPRRDAVALAALDRDAARPDGAAMRP